MKDAPRYKGALVDPERGDSENQMFLLLSYLREQTDVPQ